MLVTRPPLRSSPRATGRPGGLSLGDGLVNVATGMGGAADKNAWAKWSLGDGRGFSGGLLDPWQVAAAYMTNWIVAKVHDIPPEEMTKAWRNWQATAEQIEKLEEEEKRLGIRDTFEEGLREGLFGGAVIIMGLPGASDTPAPDAKDIRPGDLAYLTVLSKEQVSVPEFQQDLRADPRRGDAPFGHPKFYVLSGATSQRVHPSRVIVCPGKPIPKSARIPETRRFWGAPLLERINSAMQNATVAQDSVAGLLHEAKVDIISIPGLTDLVSTAAGEATLSKRLAVGALMQSMHGVKMLDGGDGSGEEHSGGEQFDTRQINFAQLPETITSFLQMASGAADIPLTRLIGTQAKGLNNGGEGDEKNFLAMIRSRQNTELRPKLERLDGYLKASAGLAPDDKAITWKFGALVEMSPKEEAEIDKEIAETFKFLGETKLLPPEGLSEVLRNKMTERQTYPGIEDAFAEVSADDIPAIAEAKLAQEAMEAGNDNAPARPVAEAGRGGSAKATAKRRTADSLADAEPMPLYVSRQVKNPQELLRWARAQGIPNLVAAGDLHVTEIYSERAVDWMKVSADWISDERGYLRIPPGGPRIIERLGLHGEVVVLSFRAMWLESRHEEFLAAGAVSKWEGYQPHISLAWEVPKDFDISKIAPYTGRIVLGPERFEVPVTKWASK